MSNTSIQLPYLAVGQAQKHVTVNETLRKLDAIIQLSVVSATVSAEPATPTDGDVYIIPSGKSGAHWSAFANWSLGYYRDGAWVDSRHAKGGWRLSAMPTSCYYYGLGLGAIACRQADHRLGKRPVAGASLRRGRCGGVAHRSGAGAVRRHEFQRHA